MLNYKLSKNEIYAIKAFAILGVIPAHIPSVSDNYSLLSRTVSALFGNIGSMGVGIFFFISGYLLAIGTAKNLLFFQYMSRKISTVVVPWFIAATLVYLYVAIRKGGSIIEYIGRLFGYMSTFWYMSVLMVFLIIYYFVVRSRFSVFFCILGFFISIFSVALRMRGIIPANSFGVYLNPMNWTVFFSAGVLFGDYEKKILTFFDKIRFVFVLVYIMILVLSLTGFRLSYYAYYYIPIELFVIGASICFGRFFKDNRYVRYIGANSFSVYLYHILPWAGLVSHFFLKFDNAFILLLIPFFVLGCTVTMLRMGLRLADKIGLGSMYCKLIGYHADF